jgi:hypothetical protein
MRGLRGASYADNPEFSLARRQHQRAMRAAGLLTSARHARRRSSRRTDHTELGDLDALADFGVMWVDQRIVGIDPSVEWDTYPVTLRGSAGCRFTIRITGCC